MPLYNLVPPCDLYSEMPRHGEKRKALEDENQDMIDEDMEQVDNPAKRQCMPILPDPSGDHTLVSFNMQLKNQQSVCMRQETDYPLSWHDVESSGCARLAGFHLDSPVLSPIEHVHPGFVHRRPLSPTPVENAPSGYMMMDGELYNENIDSDMEFAANCTEACVPSNHSQCANASGPEKCYPGCRGGVRCPVTNEIQCGCTYSGSWNLDNNNSYYVSDYY